MAASAVSGKDGVNVNGYRDYRGVPVIGAWKWLHEYGFGVTTEEDVSEAFRPLKILRYAFGFLFVLLILTILVVVFSVRIIASQQRKMQRLGQYRLERKLGKGGLGEVYKASHAMLRRPTAIKLLRPERSSKEEMERFEREVQLTSQLTHLNTVRIYDYGRTPEGVFYYAMEYLPGINLHDFIEETGPVTEGRCIHILLQICASLKEAHAFGLIHRDIKPENIIIYERGGDYDMVKVLDFGLVKYARDTQKAGVSRYEWVAGTPKYLSPEAIKTPAEIDGRGDLYSVGAVAYYLLTGSDVFGGITPTDICRKQVHDAPQPPSERLGRPISEDLESVVLSCLEKDPGRRPKDASALIEALEGCRDAGKWTQAEAKDWWIRHGKKMVGENQSSETMLPISGSKISIDLKQRERK
jgi:serine/threonine protein kinase